MKGTTDKSYSLTIYLLKAGLAEAQYLRSPNPADRYEASFSGSLTGSLFLLPSKDNPPKWLSFLSPAVKDLPTIFTKNASALLIVSLRQRIFAVSFGYGRKLLVPGTWEEDFGLKVTLNSVAKQRIRSVDRTSFDAIGQHGRIQASREADISEFGLDLEQDMIRAVTGKPTDVNLGHQLTGKDALHVILPIRIQNLPALFERYLVQYGKDTYKAQFPWIDQINEVKNPQRIEELNGILLDRLGKQEFSRLWLSIPEIIDWMAVEGFKYRTAESAATHSDVHIRDFLAEARPRSGPVTVEYLKRREVNAIGVDGAPVESWPVYRCIYCEIEDKGEMCLLSNAKWYRVGEQFVDRINRSFRSMPQASITLPEYREKSETAYNARVANESPADYALMDRKLIPCGGPYDTVEFCDLYGKTKKIVHVKRYTGGSAPLSHLFAQAVVSGTLFRRDNEFRGKVNTALPVSFRPVTNAPLPREYEVVLGIVSKSKKSLVLPFFSRVNLKNAAERLGDLGFVASILKIQAAD
jgi:uncharacterized protein (TIGR04141 family)